MNLKNPALGYDDLTGFSLHELARRSLQYTGHSDKNETWRGRVSSVEVGFSQAKTRQRITVERYHV